NFVGPSNLLAVITQCRLSRKNYLPLMDIYFDPGLMIIVLETDSEYFSDEYASSGRELKTWLHCLVIPLIFSFVPSAPLRSLRNSNRFAIFFL
ncbi:hypothetical protein L9F63_002429, partial [Diploptera punctata]